MLVGKNGSTVQHPFLYYLLFLGALIYGTDVCSQEAGKFSLNPDTLKQVQVNASPLSSRNTSLTPLQSLNAGQLEKLNSLSIADALRFFSGIQIKDYGGIGGLKTLDVRSMGTNHTAVFYDGVQLGNALNGQADLGKFSLDNIEELSLYSTQKSSIFQPAKSFASGSALYLQTKTPFFKEGETKHLQVTLRAGSFGSFNPSLLYQQKISDRISASFSTEWQSANGEYKFRYTNGVYDTTAYRKNGDINAVRFEGGLYGSLRDSSEWKIKIYHYQSDRGLPRAIVSNNFESNERLWDRNSFIQTSWQSATSKRLETLFQAKYAFDYTRYLDPDYYRADGPLDNHYRQKELYLSLANKYAINAFWNIALSGDWIMNKLDADLDFFAYPTRNTGLVVAATEFHTRSFQLQASLLGTYVAEKSNANSTKSSNSEYSPAVTASWQPFQKHDLKLQAFYKKIFRMPTFNDLYYSMIGNAALQPEYVTQYNVGATYNKNMKGGFWKNLDIQANAYYNKVDNKIVAIPSENLFRWTMINLGEVDIKGIETNIKTNMAAPGGVSLQAGLNYTYQEAVDVTPGASNYNHQIPYSPVHSGSFILGAEWKKVWINYSYIYTGERYSQKTNIPVNYIEPWYTHDLSASTHFKLSKARCKVTGEVSNIFNQYRDIVLNFPMPGRSCRLTLSTTI